MQTHTYTHKDPGQPYTGLPLASLRPHPSKAPVILNQPKSPVMDAVGGPCPASFSCWSAHPPVLVSMGVPC